MSTDTIDAEFKPLAVQSESQVAVWVPSFAVAVDDMVARVEAKHEFFKRVMREDQHYGKIPGTSSKPTLLKPGAELLLASMGLNAELSDAASPVLEYGDKDSEGLIAFRRICRIYRQVGPTEHERMKVAQAEGSCSSRESKYRWRNQERACPECGQPAIKTSKFEDSPGYFCFKKIGGCGAKFRLGDQAIESQSTGRIPNPDLADVENTILKMADKRALVAATLLATGCSDIFTQDMEDKDQPEPHIPNGGRISVEVEFPPEPEAPALITKKQAEEIEMLVRSLELEPDYKKALLDKYCGGKITRSATTFEQAGNLLTALRAESVPM